MKSSIILIAFITLCILIYKNKSNRKKKFIIVYSTISVIFLLTIFSNVFSDIFSRNKLPIKLKVSNDYIININKTKTLNNTNIKLQKVFMDLNYLAFNYSVWGKSKVVGIELKENLEDIKALKSLSGQWVGRNLIHDYSGVGCSYESNKFLDKLYLIFYLSDGNNIQFKIIDNKNIKSLTKQVNIDKTIQYDNYYFKIKSFTKALNYSLLKFTSNIDPKIFKLTLISDDRNLELKLSNWVSSSTISEGNYWCDPIKGDNIKLKITNLKTNTEKIIEIK
ncbi:hypothetical protein [Clostridium ganghwense]|uniref:Uncharacterized protein n=1 Tax=Clostridium ganghwense TaxID=312089 RepID=A0ABT4CSQ1_9CLOT|nr:hypothetical protein [Clostridium ganghwense]MCY6372095.1 hypothetical protein [Clostridium ganghwense]